MTFGINYGYYGQTSNYTSDLALIYNLGFRTIRISFPIYTDTANITLFRAVVQQAITQGFTTVIYGLTFGQSAHWGTAQEAPFLTALQAEATWAQSLNFNGLWFGVGNESTNSRNPAQVTAQQVRVFVRSCATGVKSIYTNGPLIYCESADYSSPYLAPLWASEGLGNVNRIGWNIYGDPALEPTANFTEVLNIITGALTSSQAFFTEFNINFMGLNGYVNIVDDFQGTQLLHSDFLNLIGNYIPSLFFAWQDTGNTYGTVLYPGGGYRGALASIMQTRPWYTPLSTVLTKPASVTRASTPNRVSTPTRAQFV